MKMILSGGGGQPKNPLAYELFTKSVDKHKPVLYICFASLADNFTESYGRFAVSMANQGIYSTRLCNDVSVFNEFDLNEFGGINCAGGNTFRLLKTLRDCGADKKIKDYLKNGGVYIGSSAGAIIGGADIMPIIFMDANAVLLEDTCGLDMMNGWSTIAHYGNAATELRNNEWYEAVEKLRYQYNKLIALPEECAVVIEDDRTYMLGSDCKVFENGIERIVRDGENLY